MNKYTIKKFNGDDSYSYAVFNSRDVKGLSPIIFWGQAKPIACGLSRNEAKSVATFLNRRSIENHGKIQVDKGISNTKGFISG